MIDAQDLPDGQRLTTDICIVGAGVAGIALANELSGTGIRVLLLESGSADTDRVTEQLNTGTIVDARLHSPPERYRCRRFGGWMPIRENRCAPLQPIDFETRSYLPNSGWPISADTLTPFYARALALCESEDSKKSWARDQALAQGPMIDGFDDRSFSTATIDHYRAEADFGSRFEPVLSASKNVCVVVKATVTRLQLNAAGQRVESLIFISAAGRSVTVTATRFVLAAGALESARLLLANRDVQPNGIGNDHDTVGRFYLCPLSGSVGEMVLNRPPAALWSGSTRSKAGIRSRRRLTLRPAQQKRLQIGNFAAWLRPASSNGNGLHLSPVQRFWRRQPEQRFAIEFQAEQQPGASSRIMLNDHRDALGQPRLTVDWQSSVGDFETVRLGLATLAEDLQAAAAGRLDYDPTALAALMTCRGAHGGFQLGTTRMGSDPRSSVVDRNACVHGLENLFVAGTGVFPTSGLGDPMLTVAALSLRLADHLKTLEFQDNKPMRPLTREQRRATVPADPGRDPAVRTAGRAGEMPGSAVDARNRS